MSLFFLTPGRMRSPEWALIPGGSVLRTLLMPTTVAVLGDAAGRLVLVDCGFSRAEMDATDPDFGSIQRAYFGIQDRGDRSAAALLEAHGWDPDAVTHIIATHLHVDHIGAYVDFPNAEVLATAAEYASARERGRLAGYHHVRPILRSGRARPVTLSGGEHLGFPAHLDVFGDGRILLLDARGHTAGSVAVLLTDPETGLHVLMGGDAAYSPDELRLGRKSPLAHLTAFRDDWLRATWGRLHAFEIARDTTPLVLSHDPEALARLPGPTRAPRRPVDTHEPVR